jgi:hypothetical protein
MNGELVQVQSGGLDLKSSILRPCINFLYFVANGCGRGIWKEEILDNHKSIYVSLEFQPKMKNWIYHYSTGFLNYIIIHTHSIVLLDLSYAPRVGVTQMWIL